MKYRPEIDGLRALAVIPVIIYHTGIFGFSGGYVGVDVFFVISGFLITKIISEEIAANSFTLKAFYERRARRILPALFLVLAVSSIVAWFVLLPKEMYSYSKSLLGVSTFVSNMVFWRENSYFDDAAELKPLLHTWSLSIEEQFYLVFPLLLIALYRNTKDYTIVVLWVLFLISFFLMVFGVEYKPTATFFYCQPALGN